jgi:hypothetical protein
MDRHCLDLDRLSFSSKPATGDRTSTICPVELTFYLLVIFLVVAVAGPDRVAAAAGAVAGGVGEVVRATFEHGSFLRPSW